jgi:hypothetical protein
LRGTWASHRSYKPKDDDASSPSSPGRNGERDFHGEKRSNQTHQSTTDPEAKLFRRSNATPVGLCLMGHGLMEHRNALLIYVEVSQANGCAERNTAAEMLSRLPRRKRRRSVAADKAYDTADFVAKVRTLGFTPLVAQNAANRNNAIDGRTTRH